MNDFLQDFELNWKRFETNLRGKLLSKANQQTLNIGLANIILKDASIAWFSMYDVVGKWLLSYSKENPAQGQIINGILKNDMKFTDEITQKQISPSTKIAVPLVAGVVGGGIAHMMSASLLTVVASAVVPAVALFPIISNVEKSVNDSGEESLVNGYLKQLEKFKLSIINVIQN